jgi:adenine deaminase
MEKNLKEMHRICGQFINLHQRTISPAEVCIEDGIISAITPLRSAPPVWILPGFVDAHVHIESSMLSPSGFAPLALAQGTLATISDPHEIANVLGEKGVRWMHENGKQAPLHFHFGAPSCVPATAFETAGDEIDAAGIRRLLSDGTCHYLAEMMNWPGVIFGDGMVAEKIRIAKDLGVPLDGHAPGLRGEQAKAYFAAGMQTDHECFSYDEGLEKAELGVKILIREGSAARNFDALVTLFKSHPQLLMFCSDDKHPDDLLLGHINKLAARAIRLGYDKFDVLRAACLHPVEHYGLPLGQLRPGDPADFVVIDNLEEMAVCQTWRSGQCVYERGKHCWQAEQKPDLPNKFHAHFPEVTSYLLTSEKTGTVAVRVIEAIEGQLITKEQQHPIPADNGFLMAVPEKDILHLSVVNRYQTAPPANAFIHGFGLKNAAIASSVAHDSHNVVAVGSSPALLKKAVDAVMQAGGGISLAGENFCEVLPLPIAGLMSPENGEAVAEAYLKLSQKARECGSLPSAPYMLLSFMALLVIPELKLSDRGLFNGISFSFTPVEC